MKKIFAVVFVVGCVACASCGPSLQNGLADVGGAIATAQSLVDAITGIATTTIASINELCAEKTKETSVDRAVARFQCAEITDAWDNVESQKEATQDAIDSGDSTKIDAEAKKLKTAVAEFNGVIAKSTAVLK